MKYRYLHPGYLVRTIFGEGRIKAIYPGIIAPDVEVELVTGKHATLCADFVEPIHVR